MNKGDNLSFSYTGDRESEETGEVEELIGDLQLLEKMSEAAINLRNKLLKEKVDDSIDYLFKQINKLPRIQNKTYKDIKGVSKEKDFDADMAYLLCQTYEIRDKQGDLLRILNDVKSKSDQKWCERKLKDIKKDIVERIDVMSAQDIVNSLDMYHSIEYSFIKILLQSKVAHVKGIADINELNDKISEIYRLLKKRLNSSQSCAKTLFANWVRKALALYYHDHHLKEIDYQCLMNIERETKFHVNHIFESIPTTWIEMLREEKRKCVNEMKKYFDENIVSNDFSLTYDFIIECKKHCYQNKTFITLSENLVNNIANFYSPSIHQESMKLLFDWITWIPDHCEDMYNNSDYAERFVEEESYTEQDRIKINDSHVYVILGIVYCFLKRERTIFLNETLLEPLSSVKSYTLAFPIEMLESYIDDKCCYFSSLLGKTSEDIKSILSKM